ncbi:hypothetical protein [Thermogemmatispora onikobensis]|nr:hypothetical protein [Thermogemmatispora onikobensis]
MVMHTDVVDLDAIAEGTCGGPTAGEDQGGVAILASIDKGGGLSELV